MAPPQVTKQSMQDANWVMPSYPTQDEHRISDALDKLGKGYEDAGNKPLGDCLHVIAAAFGMFLSPEHPQGPYVPQWEFGANRSAMLSDFDDSYLGVLEFALQTSKEPRARARLADILWLRKKHTSFADAAIDSYIETVYNILSKVKSQRDRCGTYLHRVSQIARSRKVEPKTVDRIKKLFRDCIEETEPVPSDHLKARALDEFVESGFLEDHVKWMDIANRQAREAMIKADYRKTQDLLEIAIKISVRSKDQEKIKHFNEKIARFHEGEARDRLKASESSMLIQHSLELAIQAYRKIGDKTKVASLHKELLDAQQNILQEMGTFEFTEDITEPVNKIIEAVSKRSTFEALIYMSRATAPPQLEDLKKEVEERAEMSPLATLMPRKIVNDKGATVAKQTGFDPRQQDEDTLEAEIIRLMGEHAKYMGRLVNEGRLEVLSRHDYTLNLFDPLLVGHTFIPADRLNLFRQGFLAGLMGDFVTANHVLVPQLENSMRLFFESAGILVASLDHEFIQKEGNLNKILEHKDAVKVIPPRILLMMKCLFIDKATFNFRNYLAHGLLTFDEHQSMLSVYIWIFILFFFWLLSPLRNQDKK